MKKRILVVEDNAALSRALRDTLMFEGFDVENIADGNVAVDHARSFQPDLIVLDIMLPGRDGFQLFGLLRQGKATPIIVVTARVEKSDKLRGLKLGADDYVTKPFDMEELVERIRAVLRRVSPRIERLELGLVTIDFRGMKARNGHRAMHLTHREFELLRYLAEHAGRVVSREELLRELWGYPDLPFTRSVDYAIARLRRKIEPDPHQPRFVHTARGGGYCLTPAGSHTFDQTPSH